jgi:hypothetical protein
MSSLQPVSPDTSVTPPSTEVNRGRGCEKGVMITLIVAAILGTLAILALTLGTTMLPYDAFPLWEVTGTLLFGGVVAAIAIGCLCRCPATYSIRTGSYVRPVPMVYVEPPPVVFHAPHHYHSVSRPGYGGYAPHPPAPPSYPPTHSSPHHSVGGGHVVPGMPPPPRH